MRRRPAGAVLAAAVAGLVLSACGSPTEGEATGGGDPSAPASSASEPGPSSPADDSSGQAPPVSDPVDVAALEQDPCAALSSSQTQERNLEQGESEPMSDGSPTCIYRYADGSGSRVRFVAVQDFANGLDDVYARADSLAVFEPTEVEGHPAVVTQTHRDDRDNGFCDLQVGLTDEYVVSLMAQVTEASEDYPQGCEVAEVLAGDMIHNLRGDA
ncbi:MULTISPECIES: DUF3558 domain-containing protein [Prauserella salsuginis group]|uniref:DUF3558 domain-containing protein n=1 Tax=Prauserella salsuginis TaxID=387889 RepID=A0ABW6FYD2_9PSEU|nr:MULTISPECIES: DUF3558 domain-containing protein [Prauserella salsuginis group]MCR3720474.1 Protein of unknown function (DUF3558) [Prauserella flava]MCR3733815.1 Protein of unknown function (DUF3558) [Prauserella salsuginis]